MGKKAERSLALLACLLIGATLGAFTLSVAFADDGYVMDADDSPGPLDIERFTFFQDEDGGHLTIDLYEPLDPSLLDEELNWIGFILEDDIVNDGYVNAVFVKYTGSGLVAGLYGRGTEGPSSKHYIEDVPVQMTDADTLDVALDERQYAWFHHWYARTSFESIGENDRGYPECNWPTPSPRPSPPMGKCIDESDSVYPTVQTSPSMTDTGGPPTPSDPPCAFRQSQCQKSYITIHRGEHSFYGVVRHRKNVCERRTVLLRRSGGEVVGRVRSKRDGKWRIHLEDAPGSYFAVARYVGIDISHGEGDVDCRRERSITIHG